MFNLPNWTKSNTQIKPFGEIFMHKLSTMKYTDSLALHCHSPGITDAITVHAQKERVQDGQFAHTVCMSNCSYLFGIVHVIQDLYIQNKNVSC